VSLSSSNTYTPLSQAALKYNLSEQSLLEWVKSGRIASAPLPTGELLVAEQDVAPSFNINREDFKHLRGQKISMSEASRKYGISHANFSRWAKTGYIKILDRGWKC
jgi:predicted site-specific integrase-resolvase